jgi:hypothetical protein
MKRLFVVLIFVFVLATLTSSNPIIPPQAFISELKFTGMNAWTLEISFQFSSPYKETDFDSICIRTKLGGFSRIRMENIPDGTTLFVCTQESLVTPVPIRPEGDSIELCSYLIHVRPGSLNDVLVLGDYPGSVIDSLPTGYSVARLSYSLFAKDNSPTIGFPNDTIGTCGTLTGLLYDKHNQLVTTGNFFLDNWFSPPSNDSFSTRVYSRRVMFDHLQYYVPPSTSRWVRIDSLTLNANPDSVYSHNINIQDTLIVDGVNETPNGTTEQVSVLNYPNPFNSSTTFVVMVPAKMERAVKHIDIFDLMGKLITRLDADDATQVTWDGRDATGSTVASGRYFYTFVVDNRMYAKGSVLLLK